MSNVTPDVVKESVAYLGFVIFISALMISVQMGSIIGAIKELKKELEKK